MRVSLPPNLEEIAALSQSLSPAFLLLPSPEGEQKVALSVGNTWTIGRSEHSTVLIRDERVSRHHAMIQRVETGEYYLIDMGSRNGSYVNRNRVSTPVTLNDGDNIALGEYQLRFQYHPYSQPTSGPEQPPKDLAQTTKALFVGRWITVFVVDVRGFTRLAQQIDQATLCQTIGTWFRQAGQMMQRHGSWTQKYIGDCIMAVWLHEAVGQEQKHMRSILTAACEIAKIAGTLQSQFNLPWPIKIGAGINTGLASIGNVGSSALTDYTALGECVNATFRMESATKDIGLDLLMSQSSFEALGEGSNPKECFEQRTVLLRGYEDPVVVWATSFARLQNLVDQLHQTTRNRRNGLQV
jgi:adenylate cyclase